MVTGPELTRLENRRTGFDGIVSTLVLPNHTLLCSTDVALLHATANEVLRVYERAMA